MIRGEQQSVRGCVELSCLNFLGLGVLGNKGHGKNPEEEFNFHIEISEQKLKG